MKLINPLLIALVIFLLNPVKIFSIENDSTVVLDSIAYRIWTDTTHYPMTQCCIPINFEYYNTTNDTLHLISGSGNIVWLSFLDDQGNEYIHMINMDTSHYSLLPFDTLEFSDTVSSGMIEWNPGIYTAKGRPDIWNTDLPSAEITVLIDVYINTDDYSNHANRFKLRQNYPNPFNVQTTIAFELAEWSRINLTIFGLKGRKIATLANEIKPPGFHEIIWDATPVSSGIYFYWLSTGSLGEAGSKVFTKKMLVLK